MQLQNLKSFLLCVNSKVSNKTDDKGWLKCTCPFAPFRHQHQVDRKPSFGVRKDKVSGQYYYSCFSCQSFGQISGLLFELKTLLSGYKDSRYRLGEAKKAYDGLNIKFELCFDDEPIVDRGTITEFPEDYLDGYKKAYDVPIARKYLQGRNVSRSVSEFLDIRFDRSKMRVCFPFRDWNNMLTGFHGRDITGKSNLPYLVYRYNKKSTNVVWLGESWVDLDKPVVLVESVFDLTSVYRVYKNVMCSFSCGMKEARIKRLKFAKELITFYDYGKGGDIARKRIKFVLRHTRINEAVPTEKQNDPGDMSKIEIKNALRNKLFINLRG